jgi:hypothetical protein
VSHRPGPPDPPIQLWLPGIVHWEGADRQLALELENFSGGTVRLEAPSARRARVTLFLGPGPEEACGVEPREGPEAGEPIAMAPGDVAPLRVDLSSACQRLPPGEYRYEVAYGAPAVSNGPPISPWVRYGTVVVGSVPERFESGSLGSGGGFR